MTAFASLRGAAPALVLGTALLAAMFFGEIQAAVSVWIASTAYNHCFLVLPIALWLAWDRRHRLAGLQPEPFWWAVLPAAGFAVLWIIANRLGVMEGQQLMAMGLLQCLFLGVLGWRIYRAMIAPFLYLFFLIPFGGFLVPALQAFTTQFTAHGLDLLGIPNYVTGNTIEISAGVFYIAQACAGLRFLIAAIAFSVLYALLIFRSFWRRLVFIGLSLFVPVVANGFRALGIVWLGHALGSAKAAATDHVLYGYIFFSIVLGLLILLGLPFRQDQGEERRPRPSAGPSLGWTAFLPRAAAIVAVAAIGPLLVLEANRAAAADHLVAPQALEGCRLTESHSVKSPQPAHGVIEDMNCGGGVHLRLALLPPRSDPKTVFDTLRAFSGQDDDKALTSIISIPQTGTRWQMVETSEPARTILSVLFVDGRPVAANMMTRVHEAWRSLFGGRHAQLVIAVSAAGLGPEVRSRLFGFIEQGEFVPVKLAALTEEAADP